MTKSFSLCIALVLTATTVNAETITTRFGSLSINDQNILLFQGKSLTPTIQGNNSLSVLGTYPLKNSDAVLIQDNGGTACPAQLYFVELSKKGVKATSVFGSCSDLVEAKQTGEIITVTMPGFMGPFEPEAEKEKAANSTETYRYAAGVVTEEKAKAPQKSSENTSGEWHTVIAEPNLVVRSKPAVTGEKLGNVPHGGKVKVIEKTDKTDSIGGRDGVWVKIEWQDTTGYAFDAFLESMDSQDSAGAK
jgi:hypothetical protein